MLGTTDENHYWICHQAADEIDSLESKLDAAATEIEELKHDLANAMRGRTTEAIARVDAETRLDTATRLLAYAVKEWTGWMDDARGREPTEPEYAEAQAFLLRNERVIETLGGGSVGSNPQGSAPNRPEGRESGPSLSGVERPAPIASGTMTLHKPLFDEGE